MTHTNDFKEWVRNKKGKVDLSCSDTGSESVLNKIFEDIANQSPANKFANSLFAARLALFILLQMGASVRACDGNIVSKLECEPRRLRSIQTGRFKENCGQTFIQKWNATNCLNKRNYHSGSRQRTEDSRRSNKQNSTPKP